MDKNQAFQALARSGGMTAARMILAAKPNPSRFWIILTAWRLRRGVPVAKIIHQKWFYGLPFYTNGATLDPRPDSETLVEAVLRATSHEPRATILDLGTGTGNLICSIVKNFPGATGVGIDKSWRACRVARRNVKDLGLEKRIKIIRSDFTQHSTLNTPHFDIIVSNPPYIAMNDPRVDRSAKFDPKMALYAGKDGLDAYRALATIKFGAKIYLEIGAGQGDAVREIFAANGWNFIESFDDLSGTERVLCFGARM
jgi:release factor glutamine methyltransferase